MSVGTRIPDRFITRDPDELEIMMFKDYVALRFPEFCSSDIAELVDDIRFDYDEWHEKALEHDPAHGIRSPYKL